MRDKQFLPVPVVRTQSCTDICFASVIRDEADYLPEWIAFHALLGVSHFYLYDNGSTDDLSAAIEASGFASCVTVLPWGTLHHQTQFVAHNRAIATFGKDFRWMGFFDVDEFVFRSMPKSTWLRPCLSSKISRWLACLGTCLARPVFRPGQMGW